MNKLPEALQLGSVFLILKPLERVSATTDVPIALVPSVYNLPVRGFTELEIVASKIGQEAPVDVSFTIIKAGLNPV